MKEANKFQTTDTSQTIVRVGNQEWVMGEHMNASVPTSFRSKEKVISLQGLNINLSKPQNQVDFTRKRFNSTDMYSAFKQKDKLSINQQSTSVLPSKPWIPYFEYIIKKMIKTLNIHKISIFKRASFQDAFRGGLIFGLLLGCISLFLFHQVQPVLPRNDSLNIEYPVFPEITTQNVGLSIPGITLYAISFGTYSSQQQADLRRNDLAKQKIVSEIFHAGSHKYIVLASPALTSTRISYDLQPFKSTSYHPEIFKLNTNAKSIQILPGTSKQDVSLVQKWLSAETSALLALTGAICDGGRMQDANTALINAQKIKPSPIDFSTTGLSLSLNQLQTFILDAFTDVQKKQMNEAKISILEAGQALMKLHGING